MLRLALTIVGAAVLAILPCASPVATAAEPTTVFVVNTQDASVSLVDLKTLKEEKRFPVGKRPYGIAVTPDARTVAVGVEDEEAVKFFSLPDFELKGKVPIGKMFNDHLVLTPDGKRMLLANFYSDDVVLIDPVEMKAVGRIEGCSAPHVVKYGPLKKNAYVTCKKVTGIAIIDPTTQQLVKFHQLNVNPRSLTFSPDESKVFFGSFWVNGFFSMDTESGKVTQLFSLDPPKDNAGSQEVTYHGVEAVGPNGGALKRFTTIEQQLEGLYQGKDPLSGDGLVFIHKDKVNKMNSVLLHELYFDGLTPKPGEPAEDIRSALTKRFGSLDRWIEDFKTCCMAANGWGMLVRDMINGRLYNVSSDLHEVGVVWLGQPLIVCDVYEHAFYVDYTNRKQEYVNKFVQFVDWKEINVRWNTLNA